jgi:phage-related minor tail protein
VRAFAKGGVVERPTAFAMPGGAGLMGEAGPEAILPLARGANGALGVRGGGVTINLTVSTPDADSFRRSGPQIAASLARMVERGRRNL